MPASVLNMRIHTALQHPLKLGGRDTIAANRHSRSEVSRQWPLEIHDTREGYEPKTSQNGDRSARHLPGFKSRPGEVLEWSSLQLRVGGWSRPSIFPFSQLKKRRETCTIPFILLFSRVPSLACRRMTWKRTRSWLMDYGSEGFQRLCSIFKLTIDVLKLGARDFTYV